MSTKEIAPIAIFAYNRPNHLYKTLQTLIRCNGFASGPITVYIDGPKDAEDKNKIKDVTNIAYEFLNKRASINCAQTNLGLSKSITLGVKEQLDKYGTVIVIEDDLSLSKNFLIYMSDALDYYYDNEEVLQISGYSYSNAVFEDSNKAIFLPFTTTWGWATWSRAWQNYDSNAEGWEILANDSLLRNKFNLDGVYDYANMLERQMIENVDSWGVRWYWSVFKKGGIVLFPPKSFVKNNGMDGSGSHGKGIFTNLSGQHTEEDSILIPEFPKNLKIISDELISAQEAIWKQNGGYPRWILERLVKVFKKIQFFLNGRH
jgi:hypothetical protein